jgi:hypothetical protein
VTPNERREQFVIDALKARGRALESGKAYAFQDVKVHYAARAVGKSAKRPRLKRWRG